MCIFDRCCVDCVEGCWGLRAMKAIVIDGGPEEIREVLGNLQAHSAIVIDEAPSLSPVHRKHAENLMKAAEHTRHFTKKFPSRISYRGGMRHKEWTKEEDKFLLENYKTMSKGKLSKILDRTKKAVFVRKTILARLVPKQQHGKHREWSAQDIEFLRGNVGKMSLKEMASKLHRSYVMISIKLKKLGIPQRKVKTAQRKGM